MVHPPLTSPAEPSLTSDCPSAPKTNYMPVTSSLLSEQNLILVSRHSSVNGSAINSLTFEKALPVYCPAVVSLSTRQSFDIAF